MSRKTDIVTRRRGREREAHRREILDAAERVFAARGYEAATVEAITAEAEFAAGTLYNFFPGKEQLFLAVADRILDDMIERFDREVEPLRDRPREAVTRYIALRLDEIRRHEPFMHVYHPIRKQLGGGSASVAHDCRQKFAKHIARVHAVFAEGIRQGILHPEPSPSEMAGLVEGALHFLHHAWAREERPPTLQQSLSRVETCLLPLLWAHPGSDRPALRKAAAPRTRRTAVLLLLCGFSALVSGCLSTAHGPVAADLRTSRQEAARRVAATGEPSDSGLPVLGGTLTLHDACNLALAHNLALRATFLRRQEAAGAVEAARGGALPRLGLTGDASSVLEERGESPDNLSVGLRLTQPLWRAGVVEAGLRYARLYAASTDAAIRQQVQQTVAAVAGHYLDVLLAGHMVTVYEESAAVAGRLLQTARNKRVAGTVSDYEVLRAEVELSTARADLLNERNRLRTAQISLLHALGADQRSEVTLADKLDYRAETHADADMLRLALESRSDLLMREADVRMAAAQADAARGAYGPEADLFVSGPRRMARPVGCRCLGDVHALRRV